MEPRQELRLVAWSSSEAWLGPEWFQALLVELPLE
jgi:hypothetical protein